MGKTEMLLSLIDLYTGGNKRAFARLLGVSPQCISSWIHRESFDMELVYAKCLGVSPHWLLSCGEGPMVMPGYERLVKKKAPCLTAGADGDIS